MENRAYLAQSKNNATQPLSWLEKIITIQRTDWGEHLGTFICVTVNFHFMFWENSLTMHMYGLKDAAKACLEAVGCKCAALIL